MTDNVAGYYAARRDLREQQIGLVVGLGGYASVPAARAASSFDVPYVLLEQNADARPSHTLARCRRIGRLLDVRQTFDRTCGKALGCA